MDPEISIRGFILAAGFGTRLKPLTEHIAKPLLPVAGATLLDHALAALHRAGVEEIGVNSHHLGPMIGDHIERRPDADRFTVFPENEILGTGGALNNARSFLELADHFLVFNGDVLCDLNLASLIDDHLNNNALATLMLVDRPEINTVHLGPNGAILHIEGAGPLRKVPDEARPLTYSGIGIFSRKILEDIGPGFSSLISPLVQSLAEDPHCVRGFVPDEVCWDDLGTLPRFLQTTQNVSHDPDHYSWLQQTELGQAGPLKMARITGHGSDRRFWRMAAPGWSTIAMLSHPGDLEFSRQLAIGGFLHKHDLGTARVQYSDEENKVILMEDLGQASLFFLARNPGTPGQKLAQRYRQVVDHLIHLQTFTEAAKTECPLAVDRILDKKILLWETEYFLKNFLVKHLGGSEEQYLFLTPVFEDLANCVAQQPMVLLHRDFQSQNIHFLQGQVRLIDIQGMRLGPLGYDIMSLVMDPYVDLSDDLKEELLERFANGCPQPAHQVRQMSLVAGLQRLMQALGAFGFLGHCKGKSEYLEYIPQALKNLKILVEMLSRPSDEKSLWEPKSLDRLSAMILSLEEKA